MGDFPRMNWVQFDEEYSLQTPPARLLSNPWPISCADQKFQEVTPGSFSSVSSSSSSLSICNLMLESRGTSPTSKLEENCKYEAFKDIQNNETEKKAEQDKYAALSSLSHNNERGEYLGWSKKVLGESSALGWSEHIRSKPRLRVDIIHICHVQLYN